MIVSVFRQNHFGGIVAMFLFLVLVYVSGYFAGVEQQTISNLPAMHSLESFMLTRPLIGYTVSFVIVFLLAILLNYVMIELNVFSRPNYLSGFFFLLFYNSNPANLTVNATLIATCVLVLVWIFLNPEVDGNLHRMKVFNATLLMGVLSVFYFPSIYWILFVPAALIIFNVFSYRKLFIAVIGFLVPWLYALTYVVWFEEWEIVPDYTAFFTFHIPEIPFTTNRQASVLFSLGCGLLLLGFVMMHHWLRQYSLKILQRRRFTLLILLGLMVITTSFHVGAPFIQHFYIASFAAAIFCAQYYLSSTRWWLDDLVTGGFILMIFINQWVKFLA